MVRLVNPSLFLPVKAAQCCPLWRRQKHLLHLQLSKTVAAGVLRFTTTGGNNEPLLCGYYKHKAGIIRGYHNTQSPRRGHTRHGSSCSACKRSQQQHLLEVRLGTGRNINMLHDWTYWRRPRILTAAPRCTAALLIVQHCAQQHSQRSLVRRAASVRWPRPLSQTHTQRLSAALTPSVLPLIWNTENLTFFFNW